VARKPRKSSASSLPRLTGLAQQVLIHLLNGIALDQYPDCCSIEEIAAALRKTPGGIRRAVNSLVDKGYASIEGEILEMVYPTVAALRQQDPSLTESAAKGILARIKR
jgi:DNA-binding IclR family transcriptional regulator